MTVATLFVDSAGVYPTLVGVERCWDVERDARTYAGDYPVVAHPPCHLWTNMAAVAWKRYGRQRPAWYPGGDDGGCFTAALRAVRAYGGVLEHPAGSHAWRAHKLCPIEASDGAGWIFWHGMPRMLQHYVCEVWQSAYGHPARKRTWLLYCGKRPPFELRWGRKAGTHQVGWFDRNKPTLSKRAASATPVAFARELIKLAEWSVVKP